MHNKLFLVLGLLAVLGLVVGLVGAITFGQPDGNAHPYVGTLLFKQNGVGWYSCTGTLLSPTVMLTAGHCVEEADNVNDVTYVRFDENAMAGRGNYPNLQAWLDAEWILASAVIPHPQHGSTGQSFDAGIVILSQPVNVGTYGQLPSEGFLDTVLAERGNNTNWFTAVGYGMQGYINPFYSDEYARYNTTARLIELRSTFADATGGAKFTNHPGGGNGGTCYGDSGGPVFYQNTNIVTAVVSWGITPCIGVDYQYRIDTASALEFVRQYVP